MDVILHGAAGATKQTVGEALLAKALKSGNPVHALNQEFSGVTAGSPLGSAADQIFAQMGLVSKKDGEKYGVMPATVAQVFSGSAPIQGIAGMTAAINTQDYTTPYGTESRILTAVALVSNVYSTALKDRTSTAAAFESWIATDQAVGQNYFFQPVLELEGTPGPEDGTVSRVTEGAKPATIVRFATSERVKTIPAHNFGIEWTDKALTNTTIDFMGISVNYFLEKVRESDVQRYMNGLFLGGDGINTGAVSVIESSSLDSESTGGVLTYKAWLKFLNRGAKRRKLTHVACNLSTFLKWQGRTGRPGLTAYDPTLFKLDPQGMIQNQAALGLDDVKFLIDDELGIPDGQFWGINASVAISRIRDTSALYNGIEKMIMERKTTMRMDWAEACFRTLGDVALEPFDILNISA